MKDLSLEHEVHMGERLTLQKGNRPVLFSNVTSIDPDMEYLHLLSPETRKRLEELRAKFARRCDA